MTTKTIDKTVVKYDRRQKSWLVLNGKTSSFPAGKDGKRQALWCALQHDHPQLCVAASDIAGQNDDDPKVVDRLLKGAQLLVKGNVYTGGKVKSQTTEEVYHVQYDGIPREYHCTCQDFDFGLARQAGQCSYGGCDVSGVGLCCKHILSVHLAWLTDWPLTDELIPFERPARCLCQECGLEPGYCRCNR